jgi:hypothetical protein
MPYSTAGKNLMLAALKGTNPTTPITHVGLYDEAVAITSVTGVASTDLLTKVGHGLSNGDLVVLRTLSGGAGLREEYPYYIVGVAGNNFQLSETSGGTVHDFTTDIASVSVVKLVEIAGGSPAYARVAIAFNAPVEGSMDDSTNGAVLNCPAGAVIDYIGFFSAVAAGTLLGIDIPDPPGESFVGQGEYRVTDADLDLNA